MAEVTEKIVTGQTEISANLEQLRYLVIRGIDGKSAYDVAVSLGFEGTEQEWLDSLVGPQGPEGKNYGFQIDTDTEIDGIIIQQPEMTVVKTVNGQSGDVTIETATINGLSGDVHLTAPALSFDQVQAVLDTMETYFNAAYTPYGAASKLTYNSGHGLYADNIFDVDRYRLSEDVTVDKNKTYFQKNGDDYTAVSPYGTEDPTEEGWYENPYSIVCAMFAQAAIQGITFKNSRYVRGSGDHNQWATWGFYPDGTYESIEGLHDPRAGALENRYLHASMQAEYAYQHGFLYDVSDPDERVRPGDLIFYYHTNEYHIQAGHVAVVLNVDGDNENIRIAEAWDSTDNRFKNPVGVRCRTVPLIGALSGDRAPDGTENPADEGWYELDETGYVHTSDTAVDSGKTYYKRGAWWFCGARFPLGAAPQKQRVRVRKDYTTYNIFGTTFTSGSFPSTYVGKKILRDWVGDFDAGFYTIVLDADFGADVKLMTYYGVEGTAYKREDHGVLLNKAGIWYLTFYVAQDELENFILYTDDSTMSFEIRGMELYKGFAIPEDYCGENSDDLLSRVEAITAPVPLEIVTHPQSITVNSGDNATFTIGVNGSDLGYQWQYKASGFWKDCSSATVGYNTDTLTVEATSGTVNRNGYQYRCIVTDANGNTATSNAAVLAVTEVTS